MLIYLFACTITVQFVIWQVHLSASFYQEIISILIY
jgi:hypothetical protein